MWFGTRWVSPAPNRSASRTRPSTLTTPRKKSWPPASLTSPPPPWKLRPKHSDERTDHLRQQRPEGIRRGTAGAQGLHRRRRAAAPLLHRLPLRGPARQRPPRRCRISQRSGPLRGLRRPARSGLRFRGCGGDFADGTRVRPRHRTRQTPAHLRQRCRRRGPQSENGRAPPQSRQPAHPPPVQQRAGVERRALRQPRGLLGAHRRHPDAAFRGKTLPGRDPSTI